MLFGVAHFAKNVVDFKKFSDKTGVKRRKSKKEFCRTKIEESLFSKRKIWVHRDRCDSC